MVPCLVTLTNLGQQSSSFGFSCISVPRLIILKRTTYFLEILWQLSLAAIVYKMATEGVLDDSKNESGIPRAVFVVRNKCPWLKYCFMKIYNEFTEKVEDVCSSLTEGSMPSRSAHAWCYFPSGTDKYTWEAPFFSPYPNFNPINTDTNLNPNPILRITAKRTSGPTGSHQTTPEPLSWP